MAACVRASPHFATETTECVIAIAHTFDTSSAAGAVKRTIFDFASLAAEPFAADAFEVDVADAVSRAAVGALRLAASRPTPAWVAFAQTTVAATVIAAFVRACLAGAGAPCEAGTAHALPAHADAVVVAFVRAAGQRSSSVGRAHFLLAGIALPTFLAITALVLGATPVPGA